MNMPLTTTLPCIQYVFDTPLTPLSRAVDTATPRVECAQTVDPLSCRIIPGERDLCGKQIFSHVGRNYLQLLVSRYKEEAVLFTGLGMAVAAVRAPRVPLLSSSQARSLGIQKMAPHSRGLLKRWTPKRRRTMAAERRNFVWTFRSI